MSSIARQLIERVRFAENLPTLPKAAIEVISLVQREASVVEIAQAIQNDPVLAGKLLRVANSSLFAMPRRVSSVERATVVLGLRTVKVLALSFSLIEALGQDKRKGFDHTGFWRRSLTTAVAGRLLAEKLKHNLSEEAFVGGLLCDIGVLAAFHCAGDLYWPVIQAMTERNEALQVVEQRVLGLTHESIGQALLSQWSLPETLCVAVATHHSPLEDDVESDSEVDVGVVQVVRASAMIADLFCLHADVKELDSVKERIVSLLGIASGALEEALEALDRHVREAAPLLSVPIGNTRDYRELQAAAASQLANLSMAAELERTEMVRREQRVRQEVVELQDQTRELAQEASTDGLTGLANRMAFDRRLAVDCETASKSGTSVGLILMDLDRFKQLNDTFGHQAGDEALKCLGKCLRNFAGDTCYPARYGGEEFAVVVTDITRRKLYALAEVIRAAIADIRLSWKGQSVRFTASVGVAHVEAHRQELRPDVLIEHADQRLYQAKEMGRNCVCMESQGRVPSVTRSGMG